MRWKRQEAGRRRGVRPALAPVEARLVLRRLKEIDHYERQLRDLQDAYARARSGRVRDDRIPKYTYESDYDGARFMLIDPDVADMGGWSLTVDYGHSQRTYPFERMTSYHSGDTWSLIMAIGEPVEAWSAFVSSDARLVFLITPDGKRLQV